MARGTILSAIRLMLRAELNQTMVVASATQGDARLNQLLSNQQSWLSSEYDFPFLEERWDVQAGVGTRYLTLPTTEDAPAGGVVAINFERPVLVETKYNTFWMDVEYGIGSEEYIHYDSDATPIPTADPIQRWRLATNVDEPANPNQFEVWPVPATTQTLRFTGQRVPLALSTDNSPCDFDDMLLVYFVAAQIAREQNNEAASDLQLKAQNRLRQLRQVYPERTKKLVLGRGRKDRFDKTRRLLPIVIVH